MPVYNEELILPLFHKRVTQVIDGLKDYDCKVILIEDGSSDNSWKIIRRISEMDPRFSGVRLSRNFGHQAAISSGYDLAPGDAVTCPPKTDPHVKLERWIEGRQGDE